MDETRCNIVLVNNDPAALGVLPELLDRHLVNPCIHTFDSVQPALAYLERHRADLVVCDSNLSLHDGVLFVQRAKVRRPRTVLLLVATEWDESLVEAALRSGAYAVISKPFEHSHFLSLVKQACDTSLLARSVYTRRLRLARLARRIQAFEIIMTHLDSPLVTRNHAVRTLIRQSRAQTKLSRESLQRSLRILRADLERHQTALLESERRLQTQFEVGSRITRDACLHAYPHSARTVEGGPLPIRRSDTMWVVQHETSVLPRSD